MTAWIVFSMSAMDLKSSEMLSLLDFLLSVLTTLWLYIILGAVNIKRIQKIVMLNWCKLYNYLFVNCIIICLQ